ncbi:hypothetical protein DIPPA_70116 [Diplonema papillatum]|nr:hypothetical protein DIPPA_70116 [Diplonema papillatum]
MDGCEDVQRELCQLVSRLQQLKKDHLDAKEAAVSVEKVSGSRKLVDAPVPAGFSAVTEGKATILSKLNEDGTQQVFYNPVQVVNRDLSTLVIRGYDAARREKPFKKGRRKEDGLRILEALSATGLRAVRYWKEIPGIDKIIVNDLLPAAVDNIKRNLDYNNVPQSKVVPNCDDAVSLMQRLGTSLSKKQLLSVSDEGAASVLLASEKMDVVDLDPYGTAAPFLDSAISCAEEGGLLCITCTDCDVLCGVHPEACHHKYGAISVKAKYCHEMAVRILLGCVERHAIRHGKYIKPLLCLQIDFYVRVFVRIHSSKAEAKLSISKMSHILQCSACSAFRVKPIGHVRVEKQSREERRTTQGVKRKLEAMSSEENNDANCTVPEVVDRPTAALNPVPSREEPRLKYSTATSVSFCSSFKPPVPGCNVCGGAVWVGGPIYSAPTQDKSFIERLIGIIDAEPSNFAAQKRVRALLAAARDELSDCPLFYQLSSLCGSLHCSTIPVTSFNSALMNAGYRTSQVHCCPEGVKTDAPPEVVYDVLKKWQEKVVAEGHPGPSALNATAKAIVAAPVRVDVDFTHCPGSDVRSRVVGEAKWGKVYEPNWGPKARATGAKKS